ncbi:hypothetical protein BGP_3181 [Beggiatoa sp. PS]|nr:hypothetical protein BGP_3181 [Beggiatoa sp. PS]
MGIVKKVISTAEKFTEIHEVYKFKTSELDIPDDRERQDENWADFEDEQGIYIFSNKTRVIYIGQSGGAVIRNENVEDRNVGARLKDHWNHDNYWSESTKITILIPDKNRIFALETHLRNNCNPIYDG